MGDRKKFNDALGSYAASNTGISDAKATADAMNKRTFHILVADAATAGTAVTETVIVQVQRAGIAKAVRIATPIAVTAHDTNYATFTVAKRTGSGSASTIASQTTKITGGSGNVTAFVPVTLTLTDANVVLAAGDVLTIAIAKASSGVALTASTSYVNVTVDVLEVD